MLVRRSRLIQRLHIPVHRSSIVSRSLHCLAVNRSTENEALYNINVLNDYKKQSQHNENPHYSSYIVSFGIISSLLYFSKSKASSVNAEVDKISLELIDGSSDDPEIEIVFIHGLGGDPYDTWFNHEYDTHLPSMLLSNSTNPTNTRMRVWSFGFPNSMFKNNAASPMSLNDISTTLFSYIYHSPIGQQNIDSESDIPIVFVTHSMGGLIAKKCIINSEDHHKQNTYMDMYNVHKRIKGIVFYATPHSGSDLADLYLLYFGSESNLNPIAWLTWFFGKAPAKSIKHLSPTYYEDELLSLQKKFLLWSDHWDIDFLSFVETRPQPLINRMVVKKQSAVAKVSHEEVIYLPYCHSNVCKVDTDDIAFIALSHYISKILRKCNQIKKFENEKSAMIQAMNENLNELKVLMIEKEKGWNVKHSQELRQLNDDFRNALSQTQKQYETQIHSMKQENNEIKKTIKRTEKCSYCKGSGVTRMICVNHGTLACRQGSCGGNRCESCGGKGVWIVEGDAKCAICKGSGITTKICRNHNTLACNRRNCGSAKCSSCGGSGWAIAQRIK